MFTTDPLTERRKGWRPRPDGTVKLVRGWESPEQIGTGQDELDPGQTTPFTPPTRDDWARPAAPSTLASPDPVEYPSQTAQSTPPPSLPIPARAAPVDAPGTASASGARIPTARPAGGTVGQPQSTVAVSGAQDIGGDWTDALGQTAEIAHSLGFDNDAIQAAQAIVRTEGGWFGAEGDKSIGGSHGPTQLYVKGQLPNFARDMGMSVTQAGVFADKNPRTALQWALNGYLGQAIRRGQQLGLRGADLATYAQRTGQVSASPERAGQWYNNLFAGGRTIGAKSTGKNAALPSPDRQEEINPADVWKQMQPAETNPASIWASLGENQQSNQETNPATVWQSLGAGAEGDIVDPGQVDQGDDSWASQLFDPNTEVPTGPRRTATPIPLAPSDRSDRSGDSSGTPSSDGQPSYAPVTPMEKHDAGTMIGTPSDDLTHPQMQEHPTTPPTMLAPQQEPQSTIFDIPVVKSGFSAETQPLPLPQPDQGRHIGPRVEGGQDFGPTAPGNAPDPNADLTPIGKQIAGAPVNPVDLHSDVQDRFTKAVVPEHIRDAPLVGGLVEQALDPAWMAGGPEAAASDVALRAGGKLVKAIGGNVIARAPAAVRLADASMGYAAKTGADAILRGLDRIQPGLGRDVARQLPAQVAAQFAASIGGGAAAAGVTAYMTPEDDPNRYAKIIGAAGVGALGTFAVLDVTPTVVRGLSEMFAPARLLPEHVQAMVAQLAHAQEGGRVSGDMWEQRILEVLADKPKGWKPWEWGFPKRGTGGDVWTAAAEFEKTKGFWAGMSPAEQALADDMWHFGEMTRREGKRLGFIKGDVTLRQGVNAYFPHLWEENWRPLVNQANKQGNTGALWTNSTRRGFNPHDFFTDFRTHDTLHDGAAAGLHPVNSVSEAWGAYVRRYESSKAKRQFAIALRKQGGPEVIQRVTKGGKMPEGWTPGKQFNIPGLEQFAVSPDMARVLDNLQKPSALRGNVLVRTGMDAFAEIKRMLFAPSAFHLANELRQTINAQGKEGIPVFAKSLYYTMNPWAYRKFMLRNSQSYVDAANAGVTMMRHHAEAPDVGAFGIKNPLAAGAFRAGVSGGTTGTAAYIQSKANLDDDQTAIENGLKAAGIGAVLGIAGGPISRSLWERSVPTMKLLTWETTRHRYGDQAAAEYVNEVFGGQNLEAIARSKTVQDVLRLTALAPDWQEGWVRQIGNGIRGVAAVPYAATHGGNTNAPLATANTWYWTNAAVTGAFMLEGLNLALNGHFTNENSEGHQLALETTGLYDKMGWKHVDDKGRPYRAYMDILGPYRGLIEAPLDPGKFVQARLGLGPSALGEMFSGKDYTGKDIVPPGEDPLKNAALRVAHLASRIAPVSGASLVQNFGKEPGPVSITSAVTGFRTSRVSPIAEQLRARDKALEDRGLSQDRIQRGNETYTNLLAEANRKFQDTINRKNLTHQQVDAELAKINHPNRADIIVAQLPTNLAGDPSRDQGIREALQKYGSFGTASSEYPADIQPENMVDVNVVAGRYWTPRQGIDALPKAQADSIRAKELAQMANEFDVEPNTLLDTIKAQSRGTQAMPVPGVSSAAIDKWVEQWKSQTSDDPMQQSALRRAQIDTIAREYNLPPDTVWNRIKLRYLPADKPGELEQSRDKALDMLYAAHDPQRFPKYQDAQGNPMGGPDQWQSFDAQVAGAKTAHDRAKPEVKALIEARDRASATQRKYILNNPDYTEYQRWFGIGRGMNEAQWAKYQKGDYPHYKDTKDPQETLSRDRIAEQWKASTPAERRTQMVRVTILGKPETVSLEAARRHIQFELQTGWSKALGLDTTGSAEGQ